MRFYSCHGVSVLSVFCLWLFGWFFGFKCFDIVLGGEVRERF